MLDMDDSLLLKLYKFLSLKVVKNLGFLGVWVIGFKWMVSVLLYLKWLYIFIKVRG